MDKATYGVMRRARNSSNARKRKGGMKRKKRTPQQMFSYYDRRFAAKKGWRTRRAKRSKKKNPMRYRGKRIRYRGKLYTRSQFRYKFGKRKYQKIVKCRKERYIRLPKHCKKRRGR